MLVTRTRAAAGALSSSAQDMAAMAEQQEQGSVEQASAVSQIHRTLARLVELTGAIERFRPQVARNAPGDVDFEMRTASRAHLEGVNAVARGTGKGGR